MEWLGLLNYAVFMAIFIGIYAILALGLNIQWGLIGLFNAGIAGFFAVGAYTSAILTEPAAEGRPLDFALVLNAPGANDPTVYEPVWRALTELIARYPVVVEPDVSEFAP